MSIIMKMDKFHRFFNYFLSEVRLYIYWGDDMEKLKEFGMLYWRQIIIGLVLALVAGCFYYSKRGHYWDSQKSLGSTQQMASSVSQNHSESQARRQICIDVKGAVNRPGIYHLQRGSRVEEAIVAAGGSKSDADLNQVNLAKELMDQQIVKVPKLGEQLIPGPTSGLASEESKDKVNLNTATKDDLTKIDGVGDKKAEKIIEYRSQHGGFKSPEDLKNINGFGEKTVAKLKDQLSV